MRLSGDNLHKILSEPLRFTDESEKDTYFILT